LSDEWGIYPQLQNPSLGTRIYSAIVFEIVYYWFQYSWWDSIKIKKVDGSIALKVC